MDKLDGATTAVIVMDFQSNILGRVENPEPIIRNANAALAAVRAAGGMAGFVHIALTDAERAAVPPTNLRFSRMAAAGAPSADGQETDIDPRVERHEGEPVFRKIRVGAMSTTDLNAALRQRGITTLVIAGFSTTGVVLSTVRDASDRDYGLVVLSDACADGDAEVHRVLMEKVFPSQAAVVTTGEFVAALS